ncbi:uncharacterized protein LOC141792003 [Halichoeres trimaculatus]|uniref:uncharacterized protein LOC141792003 n=1 Tax=Halichoeres trimaculatus TaxID=147232 RepID=UPI003D9E707C
MVRLKQILLSCLAVVLILLSVTGESSSESSSSLSSSPEESTGGETNPGSLDNRQPKVSFSNTLLSISRKRQCPLTSSWKVPVRNQQTAPRNNKRLQTPTKNKHKCPFGTKKKVPVKKKTKCNVRRNWAAFTNKKPKYPLSKKVPAKKKKCDFSKNFSYTVRKTPKVTPSNKLKYRITTNQKATVKKKAKCPVTKTRTINVNNKPTGPFSQHKTTPIKKQTRCGLSKHHKVSVNNKLRCPLKKTASVKKKTRCPYKKIMMGASGRNPKCPLRNHRKGPVKKTTKCPLSKIKNINVSNKPKCPFNKYQKVPAKKNRTCPLKKNPPVTTDKKTKSPPHIKKPVAMIHKQASLSSVRLSVPLRNKPKPPPGNKPEHSLKKKTKRSVANKIPTAHTSSGSKCPFEMPPSKKTTQLKTKDKVPLSSKPKLSTKQKMDILINYQIRLFISLKFASCVPCRRRLALQPLFPPLFPIYIPRSSLQNLLGTSSSSSLFESTICEGRLGQFQCPYGERIQIESAFYGRQNLHECLNYSMYGKKQNTNCRRDVTAIMSDMCNNRRLCYIYVDNEEMRGDPCPYTYKYMHFTASCVSQNQNQNLMAFPLH